MASKKEAGQKMNEEQKSQAQQQVSQKQQISGNFSEQKKKNKISNLFKDSIKAAKLRNISTLNNPNQQEAAYSSSTSLQHLFKESNPPSSMKICRICQTSFRNNKNKYGLFKCQHKQLFCQSCIHHYAIYKINQFEEVVCPQEICTAVIDAQGEFFTTLPITIQQKYRKIQRFNLTLNNNSLKMCPKHNCQGFIKLEGEETMVCNICKTTYCSRCLLAKHEQDCQKYELQVFLSSFEYRQCKLCKMMIQKMDGCNHMTCRCKYQFCYVCGASWTKAHYGQHDSSGNLVVNQRNNGEERCCSCWCWADCDWNRIGRIMEQCFLQVRFV